MKRKRTCELIKNIDNKIEFQQPINTDELKKMLELGWEISFKYNDNTFEIIQYNNCIELYKICIFDTKKIEYIFLSKFLDAKDFIENAEIDSKKILIIINDIIILHC